MKFFEKKTDENESSPLESHEIEAGNGKKKWFNRRVIIGVVSAVVLLWVFSTVIGFFLPSKTGHLSTNDLSAEKYSEGLSGQGPHSTGDGTGTSEDIQRDSSSDTSASLTRSSEISPQTAQRSSSSNSSGGGAGTSQGAASSGTKESITQTLDPSQQAPSETIPPTTLPGPKTSKDAPGTEVEAPPAPVSPVTRARRPGIATTEAIISVLEYELRGRWWGWRPNDLIQITDNVQNYQLGVLEVTRRSVVALAERMSRTGSTALYDPNLEMAMNWIMVKAESYWFPSAESKYKETINDMRVYLDRLEKGTANFFTRTDNLIPLLASFEDLLGSCDEILLKTKEDDGSKVSFFKVDDYFYYSKGVIDSMLTILEAVREDCYRTLDARRSVEIIDHAIYSLKKGKEIKPWIVLNSSLSSIFANHRSNLAGPVSHARFHLGLLIKALST